MSNELTTALVSVLLALVGLASLAVILSKNANTAGVLTAGGNAFSGAIRTAVSPITGGGLAGGFGGTSLPTFN